MKITLHPLKRFQNTTLDIAPLTLLTGVNCGGKTSILQALMIARILASRNSNIAPNEAIINATRCGLSLGEPSDYCPYQSDVAVFDVFDDASSFGFILESNNQATVRGDIVPAFISSGTWRISTFAAVSLHSEQRIEDRSLQDLIYDGRHALLELADRELTRSIDPITLTDKPLRVAVENNIALLSAPTEVRVGRIEELSDRLSLSYRSTTIESDWMSPVHHGAGITSVLPLLVHLCAARQGDTIVIQDPEVNLHPYGQSQLGRLFVHVASRGVQLIVESHSEHILNGIRLGTLERRSDFNDTLSCYYLGSALDGVPIASKIEFDSRGRITEWPAGFFDQAEVDLGAILRGGST